jgi:hypothetical protein
VGPSGSDVALGQVDPYEVEIRDPHDDGGDTVTISVIVGR